MPNATRSHTVLFWTVLLLFTAVRIAVLCFSPLGIFDDEGYFFAWSRLLDWGFISKPPGIAVAIRGLTAVFGTSQLALRLVGILFFFLLNVVVFYWVRAFSKKDTLALAAVLFVQGVPFLGLEGMWALTDCPLAFFWTLTSALIWKASETGKWRHWLGAGLSFAAGLQFQLTMGLFVLALIALAFVSAPEKRKVVRRGLTAIFLIGLLTWVPFLLWNSHSHWASFKQAALRANGTNGWFTLGYLVESWVGQWLVFSPLLTVVALMGVVVCFLDAVKKESNERSERARFLLAVTLPIPLFYFVLSFQCWILPDWLVGGFPLLAIVGTLYAFPRFGTFGKGVVALGIVVGLLSQLNFWMMDTYPTALAWLPQVDTLTSQPVTQEIRDTFFYGPQLARAGEDQRKAFEEDAKLPVFYFTQFFGDGAYLSFYTDPNRVYPLPTLKMRSQYDLWASRGREAGQGDNGLLISDAQDGAAILRRKALAFFDRVDTEAKTVAVMVGGRTVKTYLIQRAYGYHPPPYPPQ